jgi:hypothetical protein
MRSGPGIAPPPPKDKPKEKGKDDGKDKDQH